MVSLSDNSLSLGGLHALAILLLVVVVVVVVVVIAVVVVVVGKEEALQTLSWCFNAYHV